MNSKSTQPQAKAVRLNAAEFEQQWQEAKRCDNRPNPPVCPPVQPKPIICERESEEINIYVNTEQSQRGRSGVMAWLPWLLLGLTSLLLFGNMFMMFAAAQSTNNNTAKEVNNTVNRSREVVRVERSDRDVERYYPPALW